MCVWTSTMAVGLLTGCGASMPGRGEGVKAGSAAPGVWPRSLGFLFLARPRRFCWEPKRRLDAAFTSRGAGVTKLFPECGQRPWQACAALSRALRRPGIPIRVDLCSFVIPFSSPYIGGVDDCVNGGAGGAASIGHRASALCPIRVHPASQGFGGRVCGSMAAGRKSLAACSLWGNRGSPTDGEKDE